MRRANGWSDTRAVMGNGAGVSGACVVSVCVCACVCQCVNIVVVVRLVVVLVVVELVVGRRYLAGQTIAHPGSVKPASTPDSVKTSQHTIAP